MAEVIALCRERPCPGRPVLTPRRGVAGWFLLHRAAPPRPGWARLTPPLHRHAESSRLTAARVAVPGPGHARAEPERVLAPGSEVRGGVDVPVGHMAAGVVVAAVGALGEGELGSHRTTRRAGLGGCEPPVRDDAPPAVTGR